MSLLNTIRTALRGIASNKLRGALTALGIVIGVASVIVMLALGNGARAAVAANFRFLGSDAMMINERRALKNGEFVAAGKILSYSDGLSLPAEVPMVSRVDMSVGGNGKARHGRSVADVSFTGVNASNLAELADSGDLQPVNWPTGKQLTGADFIGQGRFFTEAETLEGAEVCVLGYQTALDLFGGDDPIGQTIWINHQSFSVIGVVAELEYTDPEQRYSRDPNTGLVLPISTAIQKLFDEEPSVNMTAHVTDESKTDEIKYQIATYLRQRHGDRGGQRREIRGRFRHHDPQRYPGRPAGRRADLRAAPGCHGGRLARGGRDRDHERHARLGHRADARDRRSAWRSGPSRAISSGSSCWRPS